MEKKAQGALEYLLLIGGAVLVAAIVIALITGTTSGQKDPRAMAKCAILTSCTTCVADAEWDCVAIDSDDTEYDGTAGNACSDLVLAGTTYKYCGTTRTV